MKPFQESAMRRPALSLIALLAIGSPTHAATLEIDLLTCLKMYVAVLAMKQGLLCVCGHY